MVEGLDYTGNTCSDSSTSLSESCIPTSVLQLVDEIKKSDKQKKDHGKTNFADQVEIPVANKRKRVRFEHAVFSVFCSSEWTGVLAIGIG